MRLLRRKRLAVGIVAGLMLLAATAVRTADPFFLTSVRELTFDTFQRIWPRDYQPAPVRIVDIDEASLAAFGQWPWPRDRLALIVARLGELGAAALAFDVIFAEADRSSPSRAIGSLDLGEGISADVARDLIARLPDNDKLLAVEMARIPAAVGFATVPSANLTRPAKKAGISFGGQNPVEILPRFPGILKSLDILEEAAAGSGGLSLSIQDTAGIVRRIPLLFNDGSALYPSLVIEALRIAQGASGIAIRTTSASGEIDSGDPAVTELRVGDFSIPTTAAGDLWLYFDRDRRDRYVSAMDLFDKSKDAALHDAIDGNIVFIGTSSVGLADIRVTPLGELVPGVSVHAQAVEQIIAGDFISRPDWAFGLEIIVTLLLGIVILAALPWLGAAWTAAFGGLSAGLIFGSAAWLFTRQGLLLDPVFPALTNLLVYATATAMLYLLTERERRFVRTAFSQYLAPELLAKLEAAPQDLQLGGEMREMTILFMDIRGFTPISEQLAPTELVAFLNTLLTPLSDEIQAEAGTIDKYIGDSIMAFWNAPLTVEDHARHACRAALAMTKRVAELNAADAFGFRAAGMPMNAVRIGVGLNTGQACVGNMGSARRFNYSVIGDAVNISSRIESSCKTVGADCVVSQDTMRAAPDFAFLEAGEIPLKGKSVPVKLFALVGAEDVAVSKEFRALAGLHKDLMQALEQADAKAAASALARCRDIAPTHLADFYDRFTDRVASLPQPSRAGSST